MENFKNNEIELRLFKDKPQLANELKLSNIENYVPYLELYDLYNISSSSDNIRIMIGYYLALLQTSMQIEGKKIKFPNILIFDEPRQQNLDGVDFVNLLRIIERLDFESCQMILTTYNIVDRKSIEKYICHEMKSSDDYLLKPI